MKINNAEYLQYSDAEKATDGKWPLSIAQSKHYVGFPTSTRWSDYIADWWVAEAEIILRSYEEHPRWGDRLIFKHDHFHLWPFAFASAWEQETT